MMRVDLFDFELARAPHRAAPCAPARQRAVVACAAPRAASRIASSRDAPSCCSRRRSAGVQRHARDSGAPQRRARARRESSVAVEATLLAAAFALVVDRARQARQAAARGRPHPLRRSLEDRACLLGALDAARRQPRARAGRSRWRSNSPGAALDQRHRRARRDAAAALHRRQAPRRRRDRPRRLPDRLRRARRRSGRAHGGAALHRAIAAPRSTQAGVERAHVTLHVGAGTFLPVKADDTPKRTSCTRNGVKSPPRPPRRSTAPRPRAGG